MGPSLLKCYLGEICAGYICSECWVKFVSFWAGPPGTAHRGHTLGTGRWRMLWNEISQLRMQKPNFSYACRNLSLKRAWTLTMCNCVWLTASCQGVHSGVSASFVFRSKGGGGGRVGKLHRSKHRTVDNWEEIWARSHCGDESLVELNSSFMYLFFTQKMHVMTGCVHVYGRQLHILRAF